TVRPMQLASVDERFDDRRTELADVERYGPLGGGAASRALGPAASEIDQMIAIGRSSPAAILYRASAIPAPPMYTFGSPTRSSSIDPATASRTRSRSAAKRADASRVRIASRERTGGFGASRLSKYRGPSKRDPMGLLAYSATPRPRRWHPKASPIG